MKNLITLVLLCLTIQVSAQESQTANIVKEDISNFWQAYDKIRATEDSALQLKYLRELYLDKGTEGLTGIVRARRYKASEYLFAINEYPKFWNSIRQNTQSVNTYASKIQTGIDGFKNLYPSYKDAKVYFEIGVFRTPGTTIDGMVLIGAEMAMTNKHTDVSEFPPSLDYFKNYTRLNPIEDLAFLNIHEFVHTQQNTPWAYDLLSQSLFEGSAEFMAELASGQKSIQPSMQYGTENDEQVQKAFTKEMFSPHYYNWIWNNTNNQFNTRDLGYYVGYAISKKHYEQSSNKELAIKELIELDYTNPQSIEAFVQKTGYFPKSIMEYKEAYEANRPRIESINGLGDIDSLVDSDINSFTINFSEAMDKRFVGTLLGESGEAGFPEITNMSFSDDGKSMTYEVKLESDKSYDLIISDAYRNEKAVPVIPFNLKFKTAKERKTKQ